VPACVFGERALAEALAWTGAFTERRSIEVVEVMAAIFPVVCLRCGKVLVSAQKQKTENI